MGIMSDNVKEFKGQDIAVHWNKKLCIGIGECGRATGNFVVGGRDPWMNPDEAKDAAEVKNVCERCPSGALTASLNGHSADETAPPENTIHVGYNGPLFIKGELEIDGAPEDGPGTQFRAALCRCGQSKNMPFCDNSHIEAGFRDKGAVGRSGDADIEAGGPLKVTPMKDASNIVSGNLTIYASGGRKVWQGKRVSLCRCGASKNKPFCDGSHKEISFKADGA